mgnify:CR=1 FL=1
MAKDIRVLTGEPSEDPSDPDLPKSTYDIGQHGFVFGEEMLPLVQAFLTNLITDEGSANLSLDRGGGLFQLLKRYREFDSSLRAEITARVQSVENAMIEEQQNRALSLSEKLDRVEILGITEGSTPDEVSIQLAIYSQSGGATSIRL